MPTSSTGRGAARAAAGPSGLAGARERFFRAIAERVAPELVEEVYLFAPARQGGRETGLAVVAVRPPAPPEAPEPTEEPPAPAASEPAADVEESPYADEQAPQLALETPAPAAAPTPAAGARRLTVYGATYRWTLKGPDRGKWEVDVVAEADAPLADIAAVVRGVYRRAGDEGEAEHLSGDAFRAELAAPPWPATR